MWSLRRPKRQAKPTFETCISRIRDADLKRRLKNISPIIEKSESEYIAKAEGESLHSIVPLDKVKSVTNVEMVSVYDPRMVGITSPGRNIYEELIIAAEHGRCPFCGHRTVTTLDHLLPKSRYSTLTVTPVNLVPSCSDCNKKKSAGTPNSPEDVPFHPYFDNIESDQWLFAEVNEEIPASLRFFIEAPKTWSKLTKQRVCKHFKMLGLDSLYASQAAVELQNIRHQLVSIFNAGGNVEVRNHLQVAAESREKARLNSWQTATYQALASSDWYCNGGFKNL